MDLRQTSEAWTNAHFTVNDLVSELLNELRNLGYNPGFHISYDHEEHHIVIDSELMKKHPSLAEKFEHYLDACAKRDQTIEDIQNLPKLDLGF